MSHFGSGSRSEETDGRIKLKRQGKISDSVSSRTLDDLEAVGLLSGIEALQE